MDISQEIREEFLRYAPHYAQIQASAALDYLVTLNAQKLLPEGIYYIILTDIAGSTAYSAEYGNDALTKEIRIFITACIASIGESQPKSKLVFIKEIGDAVLLLSNHFPDVLQWLITVHEKLQNPEPFPLKIRTIVHIGEVSLDGQIPISLAISQAFKAEKHIDDSLLALTEPAYLAAYPTITKAYRAFEKIGEIQLVGNPHKTGIFRIKAETTGDLTELVKEQPSRLVI